jgi:hypothetical protein
MVGLILLPALVVVLAACADQLDAQPPVRLPSTITGVVRNDKGPVAGAIVQVQGTPNQTTTAADGTFTLHGQGLGGSKPATMTAWSAGHYIGYVTLDPRKPSWDDRGQGVDLTLRPVFDGDNHEYTWFTEQGLTGSAACGLCHREFNEWKQDAHSQAATNPRFITMFLGSNLQGQRGQATQYASDGKTILPPDPALPDTGPGFRLDNPERAGACATCHTPVAAKMPTTNSCAWSGCHASYTAERAVSSNLNLNGVSPVGLEGIGAEGVTCEFCHKVREIIVDPGTGLPYSDMPGILSVKLARPHGDDQLFFGTLTDVARERDSYLPLQSESEFCAACHFGVFGGVVGNMKMTGGTVIYNSYGEWLASPYSDPATGRTCQDCHMPRKDTLYSVFPHRGGVARDYVVYNDHTMPGASNVDLLQNTVTMTSTATRDDDGLQVHVAIINDKAGHAVPTDAPMRSVMLVVEAFDATGAPIPLGDGPILPDWAGNYSGQAGKAFARILKDDGSGEVPATAFWRPTSEVADTRLFPFATDTSAYHFTLQRGSPATVKVKLVYRRAFQKLAEQKGWSDPDIVMHETIIAVH